MATIAKSLERKTQNRPKVPTSGLVAVPAEAHSYRGFRDWVLSGVLPEKLRIAYLSGVVSLDMTEENIDTHAAVKGAVYQTLLNLVAEQDFGKLYTDGVLIGNQQADVSNNPDGVAIRWSTFKAGRVRYIERKGQLRGLEGCPDWVLEIVSDSSVGKDKTTLRTAYHRAGIEEYWLIDARGKEVEFQILNWQPGGYVEVPREKGWVLSSVFRRQFRLTRSRDRLGTWTYRLESRPTGPKEKPRKKS